jgi:tRNA-dihydrouridine synthase B
VVLDELVLQKGKLQRRILSVPEHDHPVGGQLMGSEPHTFGRAAREMVDAGYDVVDVNFGCPVNKVLGRHRGGWLLQDPDTRWRWSTRCCRRSPATCRSP